MKLKRVMLLATLLVMTLSAVTGGTIAWFTDSVNSDTNIIKAGNLDVEVIHSNSTVTGETVDGDTELFKLPTLWEPGAVAWENLTVKNVGDLALQYKMVMNGIKENTVVLADGTTTDYKLSDVLKVGVVNGGVNATKREDAIAAAADTWTYVAEFAAEGKLLAAGSTLDVDGAVEESETYGVVIYWQPGENDNNWNVHNGKKTSDPTKNYLYIEIGINLEATQLPAESDAFDNQYDADTDDEDEGDMPLLIPEGGVYYVKVSGQGDGTTYEAESVYRVGEPFPDPQLGDVYRYGNYEYCYGYDFCGGDCETWAAFCNHKDDDEYKTAGWVVRCITDTEEPGPILSRIDKKSVLGLAKYAFLFQPSVKTVDLSTFDNLTTIPMYAFADTHLESIVIPDSITSIGEAAFMHTSLTSVDLSKSKVTSIEDMAFSVCQSLESFAFPSGIGTIEEAVLTDCSALKNIEIPASVTKINEGSFAGCVKLDTITFKGTEDEWHSIDKCNGDDKSDSPVDWNFRCPAIKVYCADDKMVTVDEWKAE